MQGYNWEERRLKSDKRVGDIRSEYQRDHARLVHSPAFRRLQAKTQVLGLGESDFYRTRLTHSMEVAQIGTAINYFLRDRYKQVSEIYEAIPDRALMNAICLAHDIGHPPFGHGGEVALNFCMRNHGGFEGNGQTLRILSRLDKYTDGYGLNPTRRMLLGVLKYPSAYSEVVNESAYKNATSGSPSWLFRASERKPPKCYLDAERDVVDWIFEAFPSDADAFRETRYISEEKHRKSLHKAIDTSIMELADDISYGVHDLEDAIALKMIDRAAWENFFSLKKDAFLAVGLDYVAVTDNLFSKESHKRKEQIGGLVHILITSSEIRETRLSNAACPLLKWNAYLEADHERLRGYLQDIVVKFVIKNENVQQLEFKGQRLVIELFEVIASDPIRFLPEKARELYVKAGEENRYRVICDFVSGMTDEYATRLYEKIFVPRRGSIFERL